MPSGSHSLFSASIRGAALDSAAAATGNEDKQPTSNSSMLPHNHSKPASKPMESVQPTTSAAAGAYAGSSHKYTASSSSYKVSESSGLIRKPSVDKVRLPSVSTSTSSAALFAHNSHDPNGVSASSARASSIDPSIHAITVGTTKINLSSAAMLKQHAKPPSGQSSAVHKSAASAAPPPARPINSGLDIGRYDGALERDEVKGRRTGSSAALAFDSSDQGSAIFVISG